MSYDLNLRPLTVKVENVDTRAQAVEWLAGQPEIVRAVTTIAGDGAIVQRPFVDEGACVDSTAQLIGGVIIKRGCYVGPFAVVRLDEKDGVEPFVLGEDSNLQDCAIVHSTTMRIGSRVIVAHQSIVHGAEVEDDVTIYIQAVVDGGGTVINRGSFLHQGSYVGKGVRVPEGRYVSPGQKVLTQAEADALPPVPAELIKIRDHVLKHNRTHVSRHLEAQRLSVK